MYAVIFLGICCVMLAMKAVFDPYGPPNPLYVKKMAEVRAAMRPGALTYAERRLLNKYDEAYPVERHSCLSDYDRFMMYQTQYAKSIR